MFIYYMTGLFFIWLVILSYLLYKTRHHYSKLIKRTKGQKIDEILDAILENDASLQKDLLTIKKEIKHITDESNFYFHKIGLVRFNPFGRTSGDQSFILAFLDKENRGITLNFIYTHEGIRVYAKKVKDGKGEEYDLSDEEERAIKQAVIKN